MAYEWVPVELYGENGNGAVRRVTIADGVSVSVGALLQLLDPRTASYSHLASSPIAGVASEEHIANKGIVEISVWTDGLFDVRSSGAATVGDWAVADFNNYVKQFAPHSSNANTLGAASFASVIGRYLETAGNDEVVVVRLNL